MTEKQFWKSTPRKILLVWDEHARFSGFGAKNGKKKKEEKEVYIDEISWL